MTLRGSFAGSVAVVMTAMLLLAASAEAATYEVSTTSDLTGSTCGNPCSLRQALTVAVSGDTVMVPAGTYTLSHGELSASAGVTVQGAGEASVTVNGAGASRVLEVKATSTATTTLNGVTITGGAFSGPGPDGGGGGIYVDAGAGPLVLTGVTVAGNSADVTSGSNNGGGGIYVNGESLSLTNTTINDNTATIGSAGTSNNGGGAIYQDGTDLTLTNSSVDGNQLTLTGNTGSNNGGTGIYMDGNTTAITGAEIDGNTGSITGTGEDGGLGIYNDGGAMTITASAIAQNSGQITDASASADGGGAVYNDGSANTYLNDTLADNSLTVTTTSGASGDGGGAIFANAGPITISSSTIADNSINQQAGGLFADDVGYTLKSTIIADNTATPSGNCFATGTGFTSDGFNLESTNTCHLTLASDLVNTEPLLDSLADNGGPTPNLGLLANSPAIGAGSCTGANGSPVTTDQRGDPRPDPGDPPGECDIGAFEVQPTANTARPSISGTALPGDMLTCSTGTWSNDPTGFSYQWNRNDTPIPDASNSSYTVQTADQGTTLTCTVTASNADGAGAPATSGGVQVPPASQIPTSTSLTDSAQSPQLGQPVTFTATVSPTPDGGTIDFSDGLKPIAGCGSVPVNGGVATCTYTFTNGNNHEVFASYSGDLDYGSSIGTLLVQLPPTFSNSAIGISIAQAAGDPAQVANNGASLAYSGVPLVAGRSTLVRVFADPVGLQVPGTSGLTATLSGTGANGNPLPGSPLTPDDGGPTALADQSIAEQLGLGSTAFNFVLPASWSQAGTISVSAEVRQPSPPPAGSESCLSACEASLSLTSIHFTQMPTYEVTPIELTWTNDQTLQLMAPTSDPSSAMALAYEAMPVQKVVNEGYQGVIDETSLQNDTGGLGGNQADLDALNLVLNWAIQQYNNVVNPQTTCSVTNGCKLPHLHDAVIGFNVGIARGDTYIHSELGAYALNFGKSTWKAYEPTAVVSAPNAIPVAHEMGHTVGRLHADHGCGGPAGGGSDPDWPDFDGFLEPTPNLANGVAPSTQVSATAPSYGVNMGWRTSGGQGPFVIFPDTAYDFMSYCGNEWEPITGEPNGTPTASDPGYEWISARGWSQEFTCLEEKVVSGCPLNEQQSGHGETVSTSAHAASLTARGQAATSRAHVVAIGGPAVSFVGYVEPGGKLISPDLLPVSHGQVETPSSPYTATLVNRRGRPIATEPLSDEASHIDPTPGHPGVGLLALQGEVPTRGAQIGGLVIRSSGYVVTSIPAPRQVPRVTIRSVRIRHSALVIRWNSHDRSRARRTVFISYSARGRRYASIWEGFDVGHASIPVSMLAHAGRVRFRISVSTGFQFFTATSKRVKLPVVAHKASVGPPPAWQVDLERAGIQLVNP